ncbi:MAG: hypothetical protein AAF638_07920 [Pseudomonadota bacterium]
MSLTRLGAGLVLAATLAACESLPTSLPGLGGSSEPEPVVSEPVAEPAVAEREDPANGVAGAALCIASAFYLADNGLMGEEQALSAGEVWTGILDVIPSTPEARQQAVDDAYVTLEALDERADGAGLVTAVDQYSEDGTCVDQDFQRDFLTRFGDPGLMQEQMQGAGG